MKAAWHEHHSNQSCSNTMPHSLDTMHGCAYKSCIVLMGAHIS